MKKHFRILLIYCIFAGDTYSDDKSFNNGRRKEKKRKLSDVRMIYCKEKKSKQKFEKQKKKIIKKPRFILRMRKHSGYCLLFCY